MAWNLNAIMDLMFTNIYEFHELSMNGWNLNALMELMFANIYEFHELSMNGWNFECINGSNVCKYI
jgi:ABC-type uncharacterized transport system permease subunit